MHSQNKKADMWYASSNLQNSKKASIEFEAKKQKAGDNTLSQIHQNGALWKDKAIT